MTGTKSPRYENVPAPCPGCGAVLTGSRGVGDTGGPRSGSLGLCTYCNGLFVYGSGLVPRGLTAEEREFVESDIDVIALLAELRLAARGR